MRKVICFMLVILLISNFSSMSFANSENNIQNTQKQLLYSIDTKNMTIEEVDKENKAKYVQLGIDKMMEKIHEDNERKGLKLIKEEVYILSSNQNVCLDNECEDAKSTVGDTINLSDYKGYPMRYVFVTDHYIHPDIIDVKEDRRLLKAIDTAISIGLGLLKPWVWVPATIIGVDIIETICEDTRRDKLQVQLSEKYTYKMYEIKDLDDILNYDWYCFGYTMKSLITSQLMMTAYDKDHNLIKPNYFETQKTIYASYYNDTDYMQEKIYNSYKLGKPEFHDRTPVPVVEK